MCWQQKAVVTFIILLTLNIRHSSPAAVIHVPADYSTIQAAIDAAIDGDEIIVSPSTYYENINFHGKNIILRSANPTSPTVVASTIIDGNQAGSVVTFSGTELTTCVLSGFTITNGRANYGGGIYGNCTMATIQYNDITANTAYGYYPYGNGGGLYNCDGIIQKNAINGNLAESDGGGLSCCDGTIENNIISNNSTNLGGGFFNCHGIIQNNIISGNSALWGGGLYSCDANINNNTIYGNLAILEGGALFGCYDIIRNCIIWQNTAYVGTQLDACTTPSYSCIQDWTGSGEGNISADPQLADPANGDFHLLPSSPCIDAGGYINGLTQDFEGDPRPWDAVSEPRGDGSDFDIGADEFIGSSWTFEPPPEGWSYRTASPPSGIPGWSHATSFTDSQSIGLQAGTSTTTDYYGSWDTWINPTTPAIPWVSNKLWRAIFTLDTDKADPNTVPFIRLRLGLTGHKAASYMQVWPNSEWIPIAQRGAGTTDFVMYFQPPIEDPNGLFAAFDLIDFDRTYGVGTVYLEEVTVDCYDLSSSYIQERWTEYYSEEGTDLCTTWHYVTSGAPYIPFVPDHACDLTPPAGIKQWTTVSQDRAFGAYTSPADIDIDGDKLYRAIYWLVCENSQNVQSNRFRVHTDDFRFSVYMSIEPGPPAESALPPTFPPKDYYVYFEFPPDSNPELRAHMLTAWDLYDFNPYGGGWSKLTKFTMEKREP